MKKPFRLIWLTVLLANSVSVLAAETGTDAQTETNGARHALLIGINNYENLPALNGALNDVEAVRALLTQRFGFLPTEIITLTDQQATRRGILNAFAQLAQVSTPLDTVYIHFSGHGSQVQDMDGDEDDGMDETIAPQDARGEDIADITDDELDIAIAHIAAKTKIVTLDSCHSGTGLRAATPGIRQRVVAPDERLHLYRHNAIRTRGVVALPKTEQYILFTGAAAYQSALDGPFAEGRYHGLFTYAYTQALATLPSDTSPTAIMREIKRQIDSLRTQLGGYPPPEPQLEAPQHRLNEPLMPYASRDSTDVKKPAEPQQSDHLSAIIKTLNNIANPAKLTMVAATDMQPVTRPRIRGIRTAVQTAPVRLHYYREGARHTNENSLQLRVSVNDACYLTLLRIDTAGQVAQIFPELQQEPYFSAEGKLLGGKVTHIPNSLGKDRKDRKDAKDAKDSPAGFTFDYRQSAGNSIIQGICTSNLKFTQQIRRQIHQLRQASTTDVRAGLESLVYTLAERKNSRAVLGMASITVELSN